MKRAVLTTRQKLQQNKHLNNYRNNHHRNNNRSSNIPSHPTCKACHALECLWDLNLLALLISHRSIPGKPIQEHSKG